MVKTKEKGDKLDVLHDKIMEKQKECENTQKELGKLLHGVQKLRNDQVEDILGEKLSTVELTTLTAKIEAKVKAFD